MRKAPVIRCVRCVRCVRCGRCSLSSIALFGALALSATGCRKRSDQPPAQNAYPAPAPAYGAQPPVQQAPGYGAGTSQQAAPVAGTPAPAAAPGGALSQPNPLAPPCQSDGQCLTHRCNTAAGKCAWPCQTDNDCIPGNRCIAPTCLPKLQ